MQLVGEVPFRTYDPCPQVLNCIHTYIGPFCFIIAMLPCKKEANQSIWKAMVIERCDCTKLKSGQLHTYKETNHIPHKTTCDNYIKNTGMVCFELQRNQCIKWASYHHKLPVDGKSWLSSYILAAASKSPRKKATYFFLQQISRQIEMALSLRQLSK